LRSSFQSLEIRNDVLTIFGVRNGDEHLRAVNVAGRVLEPRIEGRREKGEPFGFPGGPPFVWEAADADLVADVMVWAAQSPQAANEAFNITNGDVFEWRNVWPALAETLGVETGPDMPTSVAAYLEENADVWHQIVAKYDLRSRNLRELVGQGNQHADFALAYGAREGPRAFVSTIKLRQAGFAKTIDTKDSFRNALQFDHKLLRPAAK
jgi:hypothetical protein